MDRSTTIAKMCDRVIICARHSDVRESDRTEFSDEQAFCQKLQQCNDLSRDKPCVEIVISSKTSLFTKGYAIELTNVCVRLSP